MQEERKFTVGDGEEVTLRPAVPDDSEGIINTLKSSSVERSYVLMEQYGRDRQSESSFIGEIDHHKNLILVAVAGGSIVGSLSALQDEGRSLLQSPHVLNVGLHVREPYRGKGIGSQMLKYAIEWAEEQGFRKLTACIFTTNKRCLHLFGKAGFKQECVKRQHVRIGTEYIDELCMVKFLE